MSVIRTLPRLESCRRQLSGTPWGWFCEAYAPVDAAYCTSNLAYGSYMVSGRAFTPSKKHSLAHKDQSADMSAQHFSIVRATASNIHPCSEPSPPQYHSPSPQTAYAHNVVGPRLLCAVANASSVYTVSHDVNTLGGN